MQLWTQEEFKTFIEAVRGGGDIARAGCDDGSYGMELDFSAMIGR